MKETENGDVYDLYSWLECAALIYFLRVFKLFFILRFTPYNNYKNYLHSRRHTKYMFSNYKRMVPNDTKKSGTEPAYLIFIS